MFHRNVAVYVILVWTTGVGVSAVFATGFQYPASWATYDPGANGVGTDPDGYSGAVVAGQYIYFVPHTSGPGQPHAESSAKIARAV